MRQCSSSKAACITAFLHGSDWTTQRQSTCWAPHQPALVCTCCRMLAAEELAHWIMAGADFVVVPSRFEPCGLVAQAGVRYGAVPIVSAVGGLKDLVTPEVMSNNYATKEGTACL